MADDVDIPSEAVAWVEKEAYAYFESGGRELPQILSGFDGAEIHAHYELKQKRFEDQTSDDMMNALSAALFKTTGDEKFKVAPVEPAAQDDRPDYGTMAREKYEPELKYKVPQLGEVGSSAQDPQNDCNA